MRRKRLTVSIEFLIGLTCTSTALSIPSTNLVDGMLSAVGRCGVTSVGRSIEYRKSILSQPTSHEFQQQRFRTIDKIAIEQIG
jgi:hypothetical protein